MDQKPAPRTVQLNLHQAILAQARQKAEQQQAKASNNTRKQQKRGNNKNPNNVVNVGQLVSSISEMFPSLDRGVVELLLHEHAFDVEATIAQLADMISVEEEHQTSATMTQQQQVNVGSEDRHTTPESDEELAQRLAREMEHEEQASREAQEKADEAMARAMMANSPGGSGSAPGTYAHAAQSVTAATARTKKGAVVDGRSESGKWKVKQPPRRGDQGAGEGAGGGAAGSGAKHGEAAPAETEQWEVVGQSKKARKRRNKKAANAAGTAELPATAVEPAAAAAAKKGSNSSGGQVSAEKLQAARMSLTEDEKAAGLAFMKSILPSFEDGLLALLYEEHDWDLERTIEALLILTNVNGDETTVDESASGSDLSSPQSSPTPSSSTSVSDDDNENHDDLEGTEEAVGISEEWERIDEIIARMVREGEKESGVGGVAAGREITFVRDEEEDGDDETDDGVCDELVDSLEVLRRRYLTNTDYNEDSVIDATQPVDTSAAGSAFTSNLDTLAEMFPEYDRQALAVTLEANADDIEATTEEILAQAFGAALQQRGNRRGRQQFLGPKKNTDEVLAKMGVAAKARPPPGQAYYPNLPASAAPPSSAQSASKPVTTFGRSANHMDLSTKLKLQSLSQQFWFVEAELLQAVFLQCGCNAGRTIKALTEIDPTMTWQSGKQASAASADNAISGAAAKQDAAPAATQKDPAVAAARRRRRAEARKERRKQEQFTVVSRKKRNAGARYGVRTTDGDELRQSALDHASLRNKYYMEATRAYIRGDGQAAKNLSQKGREHDEMMKECYLEATEKIFTPSPSRAQGALHTVDLHKLTVPVALSVLERLLHLHEQQRQRNPNAPSWVSVITGLGHHSQGGRAQIKPAVVQHLRAHNYRYREVDGVVFIRVR